MILSRREFHIRAGRFLLIGTGFGWRVPAWAGATSSGIQVTGLRCEYRVNPLGIDATHRD